MAWTFDPFATMEKTTATGRETTISPTSDLNPVTASVSEAVLCDSDGDSLLPGSGRASLICTFSADAGAFENDNVVDFASAVTAWAGVLTSLASVV